jgi:catechol 2,3-dioxygenase-like lactoylglutathione lyase family enzyme
MSRVQLALNVDDIDEAVAFYAKLFGAEPAKRRPGYANFATGSRARPACTGVRPQASDARASGRCRGGCHNQAGPGSAAGR